MQCSDEIMQQTDTFEKDKTFLMYSSVLVKTVCINNQIEMVFNLLAVYIVMSPKFFVYFVKFWFSDGSFVITR